jgi:hypothetical protein
MEFAHLKASPWGEAVAQRLMRGKAEFLAGIKTAEASPPPPYLHTKNAYPFGQAFEFFINLSCGRRPL